MMSRGPVSLGLDRLADEGCARLRGLRVGLLCHAASVASDLRHITQILAADGVNVVQCFGPEHGIWADAQDMIAVREAPPEPVTGAPVHSLYGADEASLVPPAETLADLDVLVIDLQDVGARYYTYVYSAALSARAAAAVGVPTLVLDRPNPLGGARVEGPSIDAGFDSFVGRWPLPTRHGLTIGEVVRWVAQREGFIDAVSVLTMTGWARDMYHDATGVPWIQPSPNMPTVDTAIVYPGMCLIEGTNLSEGRGTTRPFELIGAAFADPFAWSAALDAVDLPGIQTRPVYFRPTFHKFGGQSVGGLALHVTDRDTFDPLRFGLHLLATARRLFGDALQWRTEVYEFVTNRLAIDLLFGSEDARRVIDAGGDVDALWQSWRPHAEAFKAQRAPALCYPA
ncbi:MAG: hypothetical protein ACI9U2_001978 [Bradymonadia bacterium]|jgi:uncharacterized protein YbbC (DUF1343 family)